MFLRHFGWMMAYLLSFALSGCYRSHEHALVDAGVADSETCEYDYLGDILLGLDETVPDGTSMLPTAHLGERNALLGQMDILARCHDYELRTFSLGVPSAGSFLAWNYLANLYLADAEGRRIGDLVPVLPMGREASLRFTPDFPIFVRAGERFIIQIRADVLADPLVPVVFPGVDLGRPFTFTWGARDIVTGEEIGTVIIGTIAQTVYLATSGECTLGETRHCYSGASGTEGIGRCHGSDQTCVPGPEGIPEWDQHPPDCIGEVTPYPWGDTLIDPGIGVDDDCDGETDEFDFYFCDAFSPAWPPEIFGHLGCCTDAAFMMRSDMPSPGTLIKGSTHTVYFLSEDGRRYVFPTSIELASWYHEPTLATLAGNGPAICPQVVQLPDDLLATIPIGGNVTFRPGSTLTSIVTPLGSDVWYAVTQGAILREMRIDVPGGGATCPVRVDARHLVMDMFFGNYTLGPPLTDPADYDPCFEADTTLEEELARRL